MIVWMGGSEGHYCQTVLATFIRFFWLTRRIAAYWQFPIGVLRHLVRSRKF